MTDEAKKRILIVDDEEMNREFMSVVLKSYGYAYETAKTGLEALKKTKEFLPDLILLDVMMPDMDGYETCRRLKEDPSTCHIPIIIVTALADRESKIMGLDTGASDFVTKPIDRRELMVRTKNLLKVKEFEDFLRNHNKILEVEVAKKTEELSKAFHFLDNAFRKIKQGYVDTIRRLTVVSEYKDEETASHIRRVGHYCSLLARHLGWSGEDAEKIFYASPMHDIGKVGIPSELLLKRGKLFSEEFTLMKTHTTIGGNILRDSTSEFLQMAEKIALCHHEKWDGSGYPNGLKGEDIPMEGRIMNIVDQYDAMRSPRPYKVGFGHEKVIEIITRGDGRTMPEHFDPQVLAAFKDLAGEFNKIFETYKE
ncbi:MAG: response regulator [Planctomycetes bacterium]|nr:response regulator [Planctomycetota bacterium]